MKRMWKAGLAIVAVIALAGTAIGFVAAQEGSGIPGGERLNNFIERLAGNLGISQDDLEAAIDTTQLQTVDDALANGDITEEQAAEMRARIEAGETGFGPLRQRGHKMQMRGFNHGAEVAEFIGVTPEELREAVQGGQSVVQVAEANGVSEQELTDYLLGEIEAKLAEAVESGRIDQAAADEKLAGAAEKIAECINREGPPEHSGEFGSFRGGRFHGAIPLDEGTDVTEAVSPTF